MNQGDGLGRVPIGNTVLLVPNHITSTECRLNNSYFAEMRARGVSEKTLNDPHIHISNTRLNEKSRLNNSFVKSVETRW